MKERANAKELILNRAVQMASVRGLNGLTIGQLAEELKMSKGGVCAHFPAKLDLQLAVVERAAEIFERVVVAPSLKKPRGVARLEELAEAWFGYLVGGTFEGGCFFTNAVLELDDLAEQELRQAVNQQYERLVELIELFAQQAIDKGEFRADLQVAQFAFEYISILLGALLWRGLRRSSIAERTKLAQTSLKQLMARVS